MNSQSFGGLEGAASAPRGTARAVILTSYRRPWNMERIAKACLATTQPCDVFLIDNADDPALTVRTERLPSAVSYWRAPENLGPAHRFCLAAKLTHRQVMCIDDDIFLTPEQIDTLFLAAERESDRVHGVWGETVARHWSGLRFTGHIQRVTCEVDILNRVYTLTPALARYALALARTLGFASWYDIGPTDDILVSYAGRRRPLCHDLGPLSECATSNEPGVAVWRRKNFYRDRRLVVRALQKSLGRISPPDRTAEVKADMQGVQA